MNAYEKATCDFFLSAYSETMSYAEIKEEIFNNNPAVELWIPFSQFGEDYKIFDIMDDFLEYITRNFNPKGAV